MDAITNLTLSVSAEALPKFFQLLEQGFMLEAAVGGSLRDFLCGKLGIERQYLEERVQTIFLDHNPVDDPDSAAIREDSAVALSAAMPGLAGATLRKGGRFATMRKQLSRSRAADGRSKRRTNVTVKFFNMVAKELGQDRLKNGIRILRPSFIWFLKKQFEELTTHIRSVRLDGRTIAPQDLAAVSWQAEIFLQVSPD